MRAVLLVGLPAAGKSTYRERLVSELDNPVVVSTDDLIESYAQSVGKTYNEVFHSYAKTAEKTFFNSFDSAVKEGRDIIVDRTNLSVKSRKRFLDKLREYEVDAFVIQIPNSDEWNRRLNSRPGKNIPQNVIETMMSSFQMPTLEEGFSNVFVIES